MFPHDLHQDVTNGSILVRMETLLSLDELRALPDAWDCSKPGVYFLWRGDELMYVGSSRNVNTRMIHHNCAMRFGNRGGTYNVVVEHDRATAMRVPEEDAKRTEYAYIYEYKPVMNKNGTKRRFK